MTAGRTRWQGQLKTVVPRAKADFSLLHRAELKNKTGRGTKQKPSRTILQEPLGSASSENSLETRYSNS